MKKLYFLLIAIVTLISCQEDLIPEVINETSDEVNKSEILDLLNYNRTVQCEYVNPDGSGVLEYMDYKNLPELEWNDNLFKAAEIQTLYMSNTGNFSHNWGDGTTLLDRLKMADAYYLPAGENIACGMLTEKDVITAWINSEGHRKNILNKNFNIVAVAKKGKCWTMVLGYKL